MNKFVLLSLALTMAMTFATLSKDNNQQTGKYVGDEKMAADWTHIDQRGVPVWWQDAKFGIFIHWGVYSVPSYAPKGMYSEWYWYNKDAYSVKKKNQYRHDKTNEFHDRVYGKNKTYQEFAPEFTAELFDPEHWAKVFDNAGAKYVVLTSKHHDGYTLWPNKHASDSFGYPWNSAEVGPKRDLVGDLTKAVNATGVKMGVYYSLLEWFNPVWEKNKDEYVEKVMLPQMYELVNQYEPAVLFTDGDWAAHYDKWRSVEFLDWLTKESPVKDDIVFNDRWGKVRKLHGGYFTTEYGAGLKDSELPWEENRGVGFSFGFNRMETLVDYSSAKQLIFMLVDIVSRGGNFLLDVGPTADGRIPVIMEDRLNQIGQWLNVNGEAIYGTRKWIKDAQWSEGKDPGFNAAEIKGDLSGEGYDVFELTINPKPGYAVKELYFTSKAQELFALMPSWPETNKITVKDVELSNDSVVTMLGIEKPLSWIKTDRGIEVSLPVLTPGKLPSEHIWTLKLSKVKS